MHILIILILIGSMSLSHATETAVIRAAQDTHLNPVAVLEQFDPNDQRPIVPWSLNQPRRDELIGDRIEAGNTYYDYQTNGCVGKRIGLDNNGGVHVSWMDGYNNDVENGTRHQKYNFFSDDEWGWDDGTGVQEAGDRGGYGCLWITDDDNPRAMVFYHITVGGTVWSMCGSDLDVGLGVFISERLPKYPDNEVLWPAGVMSHDNGLIHVVYNRRDARLISYTFGTLDEDGFPLFEEDSPVPVAETHLNCYRIARSPHSDRVAITYPQTRIGLPTPQEWADHFAYQMNNDMMLVISEDGEEWDFEHPINITNCIPPNTDYNDPIDPDGNLIEGGDFRYYGDTLRPFCTHDIIFDHDDNVHVIFDALAIWEDPLSEEAPPIDGFTRDAALLFHWSEETEEITPVADGWFSQAIWEPDPDNEGDSTVDVWPMPGAWKANVCNPSLAYDDNGDLFCVFNYFPYEDYNRIIDAGGFDTGRNNGDIAVTVSEDNGITWYEPTYITVTTTPEVEPGSAMCEYYPTLAEKIDDYLHIFYLMDTEPGNAVQNANAIRTNNPVFYHKVAVEDISREELWNPWDRWDRGLFFHVDPDSSRHVKDNLTAPTEFVLTGIYPNPFNNRTTIGFVTGKPQELTVDIYSVDGRKVVGILTGLLQPGGHNVTWNAEGMAAGVYVVRLTGSNTSFYHKVALVR